MRFVLVFLLGVSVGLPLWAETPARETRSVAARFDAYRAAEPEIAPDFAPITNRNLGISLSSVQDWSVEQPFLDLMKTARPWIGHLPGQWGGWGEAELRAAGALDAAGWPGFVPAQLEAISTVILTDLPPEAGGLRGRYILSYEGKGQLDLGGRAQKVTPLASGLQFDFTPGEGAVVLTLRAIDAADPLRNIRVVRADRQALLAAGELFNPDFLARFTGVRLLRFMDWQSTNASALARVEDLPQLSDYSWARQGVPLEVVLALANRLQADAWLNVPHLADDALVREMAQIVARDLDPALRVWLEYSNEMWNWQFAQTTWAEAQGLALWGKPETWVRYYGHRAAQVMVIWAEVLPAERLTRVLTVQTGWLGLEAEIFKGIAGRADQFFDAYAVTGYVSAGLGGEAKAALLRDWLAQSATAAQTAAAALGLSGAEAEAYRNSHRYDLARQMAAAELRNGGITGDAVDSVQDLDTRILPYHVGVASAQGLDLVMYEGGSHVVGLGALVEDAALTAFFIDFHAAPEMGEIYTALLQVWARHSAAPFMSFGSSYTPNKWGSWGALRHLFDTTPRWQVLQAGCPPC